MPQQKKKKKRVEGVLYRECQPNSLDDDCHFPLSSISESSTTAGVFHDTRGRQSLCRSFFVRHALDTPTAVFAEAVAHESPTVRMHTVSLCT
jgi:hypothetical protein